MNHNNYLTQKTLQRVYYKVEKTINKNRRQMLIIIRVYDLYQEKRKVIHFFRDTKIPSVLDYLLQMFLQCTDQKENSKKNN